MVFWHGWGMRSTAWQTLVELLKARNTVVLPPLPGYDDTPFPTPYTAEAVTDALLSQQDAPITLCGWSLGALLAMVAAHRHPEKIERLILFSATPSFVQRENWPHAVAPHMLTEFANAIQADAETALKRFIGMFNHNDVNAKNNVRELGNFNLPPLEVLAGGLSILRDLDLRELTASIKQPVLIIHGAHDPLMPIPAVEWLTASLPNATLKICPQAAHAPFISAPEQCADWISEWLTIEGDMPVRHSKVIPSPCEGEG